MLIIVLRFGLVLELTCCVILRNYLTALILFQNDLKIIILYCLKGVFGQAKESPQ